MAAGIDGGTVNVEIARSAELNAQITGGAEVSVDLTPSAEVTVDLTAGAEVALELTEGNAVNVEVRTDRELRFLPDGALADYYRREETDAALTRKADRTELELKADRTELDGKAPAVHDHDGRYYTENETDALLALRVPKTDVQFRFYDSVDDLGLTAGSATISDAVTALIARPPARLFCNSSDFANAEVPSQYGEVEIVALAANRVTIWFYGQTSAYPDRRMYLLDGTPTGTWVKYRSELDEEYVFYDSVSDIGLTDGSATIAGAYAALPNRSILIVNVDQFASGQASGALIIMVKRSPSYGVILNMARGGNIYHQPLNSDSVPTGTWTRFTETSDFVTEECTGSTGSISAGGNKTGSITITKSGYTPIAIAGFNSGNTWLVVSQMYISSSTTLNYTVRNVHASSSGSGTVSVKILYRKN